MSCAASETNRRHRSKKKRAAITGLLGTVRTVRFIGNASGGRESSAKFRSEARSQTARCRCRRSDVAEAADPRHARGPGLISIVL